MQSRFLTIREQWLLLGVAGAIVMGASVLLWRGNAPAVVPDDSFTPLPAPSEPVPVEPLTAPALKPEPEPEPKVRIGVGILGAVEQEGLYFFDEGARIADLLEAAGGALPEADLSDINRTALLLDETTLLVPELIVEDGESYTYPDTTYNPEPYTRSTWYQFDTPEASDTPGASPSGASGSGGLVNINTASQAELERLPGVGPATAQKIIAYRSNTPFGTIDDLEKVSGIGPAKMAAVRNLITVN